MSNLQKALQKINQLYPTYLFSDEIRQKKFDWWLRAFNISDDFEGWVYEIC